MDPASTSTSEKRSGHMRTHSGARPTAMLKQSPGLPNDAPRPGPGASSQGSGEAVGASPWWPWQRGPILLLPWQQAPPVVGGGAQQSVQVAPSGERGRAGRGTVRSAASACSAALHRVPSAPAPHAEPTWPESRPRGPEGLPVPPSPGTLSVLAKHLGPHGRPGSAGPRPSSAPLRLW